MLSGPHALLGSRLSRTSLTSEAVSSIESSFSPTPLKGGALSVGEAVLEMILKCRPLSYVSSEDYEEPLRLHMFCVVIES